MFWENLKLLCPQNLRDKLPKRVRAGPVHHIYGIVGKKNVPYLMLQKSTVPEILCCWQSRIWLWKVALECELLPRYSRTTFLQLIKCGHFRAYFFMANHNVRISDNREYFPFFHGFSNKIQENRFNESDFDEMFFPLFHVYYTKKDSPELLAEIYDLRWRLVCGLFTYFKAGNLRNIRWGK